MDNHKEEKSIDSQKKRTRIQASTSSSDDEEDIKQDNQSSKGSKRKKGIAVLAVKNVVKKLKIGETKYDSSNEEKSVAEEEKTNDLEEIANGENALSDTDSEISTSEI